MDQPIEENSNLSSLNSNLSAFDSLDPDLQDLVSDIAKRIYDGEKITYDPDLLHHTAKPLVDGIQKGYGKSIVDVEYNSPDYKALENLTRNAFQFSASKDFHILQDMTNALRDGDRVRSFDEFRAEVDKINVKYNQNWLRTEYNQAIAASQATARWQEFQENAKAMPFLQYQAVMDSNTRPDHQRLHGVIKRIDNPFWNTHFPPLGWGCRCEVIQLPGKNHKETPDGSFQKPDVPPQFRENFGKEQQLFSDKHPYYQNKCQGCAKTAKMATENNAQCQACLKGAKECANYINEVRDKKESQKVDMATQNATAKAKSIKAAEGVGTWRTAKENARLSINSKADKNELEANKKCALSVLNSFPDMELGIRPHIISKDGVRNPEYSSGDMLGDRKGVEGFGSIGDEFNRALKQGCQFIVIDLDFNDLKLNIKELKKALKNRHSDFENGLMKACYVVYNNKSIVITMDQFKKGVAIAEFKIEKVLKKLL